MLARLYLSKVHILKHKLKGSHHSSYQVSFPHAYGVRFSQLYRSHVLGLPSFTSFLWRHVSSFRCLLVIGTHGVLLGLLLREYALDSLVWWWVIWFKNWRRLISLFKGHQIQILVVFDRCILGIICELLSAVELPWLVIDLVFERFDLPLAHISSLLLTIGSLFPAFVPVAIQAMETLS